MRTQRLRTAFLCASIVVATSARGADDLPRLTLGPTTVSVSGISSGAYMAHQFHIAHSATVVGAGILAGGPYHCAGDGVGGLMVALNACMDLPDLVPFTGPPSLDRSTAAIAAAARADAIDDPANLRDDRVYLFSGIRDNLVPRPVMDALHALYGRYMPADRVLYVTGIEAGHAMVTAGYGNPCESSTAPFVNDCGYDAAGALLAHILGPLNPKADAAGMLAAFDQRPFAADWEPSSLHARGHIYVPKTCAAGAPCRLHVAFHGCRQSEDWIDDAFFRHAGYNEWAEANGIVVLYPQVGRLGTLWPNPQGCWDWWGYTGDDYDRRSGAQIAAIKAMIDQLTGATVRGQAAEEP